jgi:DNA-binding CsgD family transcriptional regulator
MNYTTKKEKREIMDRLHALVNDGHSLTIKRYQRLVLWLEGNTFAEIAKVEGVTAQAVSQSVRRDFLRVQTFVKDNNK